MGKTTQSVDNIAKVLAQLTAKFDTLLKEYIEMQLELVRLNAIVKVAPQDVELNQINVLNRNLQTLHKKIHAPEREAQILAISDQDTRRKLLLQHHNLIDVLTIESKWAMKYYAHVDNSLYAKLPKNQRPKLKRFPQLSLFYCTGQEKMKLGWSMLNKKYIRKGSPYQRTERNW